MDEELERVVYLEIEHDSVLVFSTHGVCGPYPMSLFLCEIYEKLRNRFEYGKNETEFFNYQDPHGAWTLLDDFFKKTNYLRNVTLRDFEEYRFRYGVALEFKKGESAELYSIFNAPGEIAAVKAFSRDLDQWRIFDKNIADNTEFLPDVFHYDSCRTMIDFTFALVHYLVFNEHKIIQCAHCGHLFATKKGKKNGEERHCCRQSPFAGYEEYQCKKAVKAIKDMLEKKRISEYERLRVKAVEYGASSRHNQIFNDFCVSCDGYKAALKKGASVELLQEYKAFLFDSANVRPKYERIKNW